MARPERYVKLLRGLLGGEVAYIGPFYVLMDVTRRCNLRCVGCRFHSPKANMPAPGDQSVHDISFELVEVLCRDLQKMGTSSLMLLGEGEPLLHPRLVDIVAAGKRAGLQVSLLTNGTLLDCQNVQALFDAGLDLLRVSLWATTPEEYARNYPATDPKMLERVLAGVRLAVAMKAESGRKLPRLGLHQPLDHYNAANMGALVDLALALGCDSVSFSPLRPLRGALNEAALSADEEAAVRRSLAQLRTRLRATRLTHNFDETLLRYKAGEGAWRDLPCYVGWAQVRVKVDGTILPCGCCDLPMGNLYQNSLPEIWNSAAYRSFRARTITRAGMASLAADCDCGFCCHYADNRRVHRYFRWFASLCAAAGGRK